MTITYTDELPATDALVPVLESTGWWRDSFPTPERLAEALGATWYTISAYADGRLVGFGRVVSDGVIHALLVEIIVLPDFQHRAIGSTILARLVARCRAAGIRSIQLFAAHDKAVFYEKRGFVRRPDEAPGMDYRGP